MPKFSRRHYKDVAETIRDMYENDPAVDYAMAGLIMQRFTLMFKRDNPRFKASRFEEACGVGSWDAKTQGGSRMTHIDSMVLVNIRLQLEREAVNWHEANLAIKSDVQRDAFKAGHRQGWNDLLSYLRQHKLLKETAE